MRWIAVLFSEIVARVRPGVSASEAALPPISAPDQESTFAVTLKPVFQKYRWNAEKPNSLSHSEDNESGISKSRGFHACVAEDSSPVQHDYAVL